MNRWIYPKCSAMKFSGKGQRSRRIAAKIGLKLSGKSVAALQNEEEQQQERHRNNPDVHQHLNFYYRAFLIIDDDKVRCVKWSWHGTVVRRKPDVSSDVKRSFGLPIVFPEQLDIHTR